MATVRANAAGEILQFLQTPQEEASNPGPITGQAFETRFDEETNPGILASFNQNSNAWTMPGGTLTFDGTPATIHPPSGYFNARGRVPALLAKLKTTDNFTRADLADLFRVVLRHAGVLPSGD